MTPDQHRAQRDMVLAATRCVHHPDVYVMRSQRSERDAIRRKMCDPRLDRSGRFAIHEEMALRPCPKCGERGGFMWCQRCDGRTAA